MANKGGRRPEFGVLIIDQDQVRTLLSIAECIAVMRRALSALALGKARMPLRQTLWLPDRSGVLATMPAHLEKPAALGLKVITFFPGNLGTSRDTHQGSVQLFDPGDGRLLAIVDASAITAIRTAAVSAVATALLAVPEAKILAIIGSGTQARAHLEAMLTVRPIETVRVWSRTPEHAERFAADGAHRWDIPIEVSVSAEAAVGEAQIICTVTSAQTPVVRGAWIAAGAHVNAVGSSVPFARELDAEAMVRGRLFVDRRESALNEAGDFLLAKQEGQIGDDHIVAEIGDLLTGQSAGRIGSEEITIFKSLGLAVEDVAAGHHIYRRALAERMGQTIELGGRRHADA